MDCILTYCRATLVDQETGSVYQLVERGGGGLKGCRPALPATRRLPGQVSIDLGQLQQARSGLQTAGEAGRGAGLGREADQPDWETERYIAVPLSATEQYLISSSGQVSCSYLSPTM